MPRDIQSFNVKITLCQPHKPWRGKNVMINWPGWEHPIAVHIYPHTEHNLDRGTDVIVRYEVSWSSLGACEVLQARRYAHAIEMAATEASILTEKYLGRDYK